MHSISRLLSSEATRRKRRVSSGIVHLCDLLGENATFVRAAQATVQAARGEFGAGSLEEQAVTKAWKDVKVL